MGGFELDLCSSKQRKGQAFLNMVINLWVPKIRGISELAEELLASLSYVADRVLSL